MIFYIQGILTIAAPHHAIIEAGGVGYCLLISLTTYAKLPPLLTPCRLYTAQVVRDGAPSLYGFTTTEEQGLFEQLLTVNGVGPKLAIALLGHYPYQRIIEAIAAEDVKSLSAVPGIGKKTAQRLIIDLRDKLSKSHPQHSGGCCANAHDVLRKATAALVTLGYNEAAAQRAVSAAAGPAVGETPLPSLIAAALQNIK